MAVRVGIDVGSDTVKTVIVGSDGSLRTLPILAVRGQPLQRAKEALESIRSSVDTSEFLLGVTGTGAPALCELLHIDPIHEPNAIAAAMSNLYPEVRTVVEMGREGQKYLLFEKDSVSGQLLLADSNLGNKCAAGSGSFLDHMYKRLNYPSIEDFARVALEESNPATLSGRCSVFTESDIVHLYQKGTPRERIAAGIHQAICRNYRSTFARGKQFVDQVAFIGGVSENPAVIKYLSDELNLNGSLLVPEHNRTIGAIGAALRAASAIDLDRALRDLGEYLTRPLEYAGAEPLSMKRSEILSPQAEASIPTEVEVAALGIDIGSVSTKAALITEIDGKTHVLASYYRRTNGDPLAAVRDTLGQIHSQIQEKGYNIGEIVAATTGSGRYLTADYVGADLIKNEITAQANGALAFVDDLDSIFEIGGQDSKFIRLDGHVITDFEMNKACAAGTGAFLEKQASRLGLEIQDFGDHALKGTNPPELDWTCTVFAESAMVYYQQNNVPREDLCAAICLASVKNYLHKNVGSRDIGEKIVFQGAVAFNKGIVAAYETLLGRKIIVPPYPHITGAVGAARLAYKFRPEKSSFRGFDAIAEGSYEVGSFECRACANRCDVNTFEMTNGPKYFYNDRCEKYSAVYKKDPAHGFPNLFKEHEELMMTVYDKEGPEGAKRVGIPRGLMFTEYFPLYKAFFTELGFQVVPSDPTSKRIIDLGLSSAIGEPCFPYKVAHGHYRDLVKKGVDYIFAPGVINTEQSNPNFRQSQTCPYLQAAPEVISTCIGLPETGIKHIVPRLHFKRGYRSILRAFKQVAREVGRDPAEAKKALDTGLAALKEYRRRVEERGREILDGLGPDQAAFVVVGRPYTLYDEALNMDIGKKIQDLGILAIPQDYLPTADEDISDSWPNTYSRQIQKKLAAARVIRRDPRLRAVVLTYFACGPDSFANPFFKDEVAEPCYIMQIDEHTADAGVITRIEAFADTALKSDETQEFEAIRTTDKSVLDMEGRALWIPYLNESARVLAAGLRAYGVNAWPLARSTDPGLNRARRAISEDVCLPALMTTEDILQRVEQPDFDPAKEAFFQGHSEGPCRFGMYYMLQRRILDKLGLRDVEMVTLGVKSEHGGLGIFFTMVVWDGLVCHDLLFKMMCRVRPYEVNAGESEALFERYMQKLTDLIPAHKERVESRKGRRRAILGSHLDDFTALLQDAQREFARIPIRDERRPLVGVVGEFYVRLHDQANQDVVRKIEKGGGEAWLAPMTEFFSYINYLGLMLSKERFRDTFRREDLNTIVASWVNNHIATRDEHKLFHATLPFLQGYEDISCKEIIEEGSKYVHYTFGGEAICSMGKSEDFAKRGLEGIVSVIPFNCMPGNTVTALSPALRKRHNNLPFLNLDYDGFIDSSRDAKLSSFMSQVQERFKSKNPRTEEEDGEVVEIVSLTKIEPDSEDEVCEGAEATESLR
ncbi:MAG: acyl-CoA dehydratase activase [Armatimonadota bacterium]|nr:acyl-CoA dehydratase activase [Armatimonadota bacterium]